MLSNFLISKITSFDTAWKRYIGHFCYNCDLILLRILQMDIHILVRMAMLRKSLDVFRKHFLWRHHQILSVNHLLYLLFVWWQCSLLWVLFPQQSRPKCMDTCEWCDHYFCLLDDIEWTASSIICCCWFLQSSLFLMLFIGRNMR